MKSLTHKYTNRLSQEKSPYLLQHAHNPVDWYPWGEEAFAKAKEEDRPVFLSIGYSTCHWCHVMERESFEDEEVAAILNKHFVPIKVDREERPDIDHVYMSFCQATTGHGGWPLTVFLSPDKKPFFAGTYFPKESRPGLIGFLKVLEVVIDAWAENRPALLESSDRVIEALAPQNAADTSELTREDLDNAYQSFAKVFDQRYGGFGSAPKFPTPHNLAFLLGYGRLAGEDTALEIVDRTLDAMHRGGMYDHIGFGFSRYSTDARWLVPHFEKMLYDNALLAMAYLEGYQVTKKEQYRDVAGQIFTYVLRDMCSPEGGFYSAEDADSEGEEGKFYLWTPDEVKSVLGKDKGELFCNVYDITEHGNFESRNIPNLLASSWHDAREKVHATERQKLFEHREQRIKPFKDDKILTSWNGLMIAALARGYRVLGIREYRDAAEETIGFILEKMCRPDGRLLARYRDGEASFPAYVDDYAFLIWALIETYQATFNMNYLNTALDLNQRMIDLFWDDKHSGLFFYGRDAEEQVYRPKEIYDGAIPSGNSVAAYNFMRLSRLAARPDLEEKAHEIFRMASDEVRHAHRGYAAMMTAAMFSIFPSREIVLVGKEKAKDIQQMLKTVNVSYLPNTVTILVSKRDEDIEEDEPFGEYTSIDGKATAYVCENFACQAPVTDPAELRRMLQPG
ncbi:MAG: thioredoxin domain-containing protein [Candidatus Saccharibacteria bacterium]